MRFQKKIIYELAISFWLGVGLMSIINVWKLSIGNSPLEYSWIMFIVSIVFIIISLVLIKTKGIKDE